MVFIIINMVHMVVECSSHLSSIFKKNLKMIFDRGSNTRVDHLMHLKNDVWHNIERIKII